MESSTYPGTVPPPPGVTPDLENPQDAKYSLLLGWLCACSILATIFFLIRAYAKVCILRKILTEDVTCGIAWVLFILYCVTTGISVHYGQGHHAWEVSPEDDREIRRWLYAGTVIYCPASYFTKVTLLLIIARIFTVREKVAKSLYYFIGALMVAYLPIQFVKIFVCSPIKAYWDSSVKGTCLNQTQLFFADISLAILTDFVILVIPIPLTWSLRAPLGTKLRVLAFLSAGGAATAVTTYRQVLAVRFMHSKDVTADFAEIIITVLLELSIGLICSCLPTVNFMVERSGITKTPVFRRLLSSFSVILCRTRETNETDNEANLPTIVTIGRMSKRNGRGPKSPDVDLDGSFERLEDGSVQGSTDNLYVNARRISDSQGYNMGVTREAPHVDRRG